MSPSSVRRSSVASDSTDSHPERPYIPGDSRDRYLLRTYPHAFEVWDGAVRFQFGVNARDFTVRRYRERIKIRGADKDQSVVKEFTASVDRLVCLRTGERRRRPHYVDQTPVQTATEAAVAVSAESPSVSQWGLIGDWSAVGNWADES